MRIIFLDLDGVLNSERFGRTLDEAHRQLGHHEVCECFRLTRQIDRGAVLRLNRLVAETEAKIVISSSWRKLMDPLELHRVLVEHGLVADIIGETPDGPNDPEMLAAFGHIDRMFRGHEIDLWLQKHPEVDRFLILDDCSDMAMHTNRLVQTDPEYGLTDEDVELAIRVMSWDGKTIPAPMGEMVDRETDSRAGAFISLHCNEGGCLEELTLSRRTLSAREGEHKYLQPALVEAAVLLDWRLHQGVWWCSTHVLAKRLECKRCLAACPACSCMGGPFADAVDGDGKSIPLEEAQ